MLAVAGGEAANRELNAVDTRPLLDAIIIISKNRSWSIEELHKTGLEFLRTNGTLPKATKVQPIVHILPDDKVTMCEILYLQSFGKPFWRVKIGYDGKVMSFEKRLMKEG